MVGKLIWILIIVGILVAKWGIRRILGVEMVIVGIHFKTKANRRLKDSEKLGIFFCVQIKQTKSLFIEEKK